MWLLSKIKQVLMVLKPGVVTLGYPFVKSVVPAGFRGVPVFDHHKCIGCGGCSDHCSSRCILMSDVCQEVRVLLYDGSRCTYCGRCAEVCPEKAITMSPEFEIATEKNYDNTTKIELFMLTCQRCGRCFEQEKTNALEKMSLKGFRYDNLEQKVMVRKTTERFNPQMLVSDDYKRPTSTRKN